jgi:hypothetical protein
MRIFKRAAIALVTAACAWILFHELIHLHRYGHLVPLGLHADVVVTTADDLLGVEGTAKIYHASFTNYGIRPTAVIVCDYLNWASMRSTMVNYIVEKWDPQSRGWKFVSEWDSDGSRLFCRPAFEVTETHLVERRLWPGQTVSVGEGVPAQLGGFHVGDTGRFTIFLAADGDGNNSISTAGFRVDQELKNHVVLRTR